MTGEHTLEQLARAAYALGRAETIDTQWAEISELAESIMGYGLLTSLVYLKEQRLLRRVFTTDDLVCPRGGFKTTGKGPWSLQVLDQGLPYVGSDERDIRSVFSEAEILIDRGLNSVLNVPIWSAGVVIGSLNLLHHKHAYDHLDKRLIYMVSAICAPAFLLAREVELGTITSVDMSKLDSV